ncbi:MAG: Polyketide cyclase / dehydrase family protein [Frankiales bacterium]|nr:Polyketide cyclase / dehydrase family protein [Frankiales bacterium]
MPDQSTQSILVNASPATVMAVIADFDSYPKWAKSVKSAVVTKVGGDGRPEQVEFRLDAGAIRDEYELAYIWDDDRSVSWNLIKGQMQKSQRGSYELLARPEGTEVTYSLTVDLAIPILGLLKRKAEKVIMDTALKELKKRAEAL